MKRTYIYLTWIATVVGAPILILLYNVLFQPGDSGKDALVFLPIIFLFGFLVSLPALIVYLLFFELMKQRISDAVTMRLSLLFLSLFLIGISFVIIGQNAPKYVARSYELASLVAALIFWRRLSS